MDVGEARKKSIGGHGVSLIGKRSEVKAIRWIFHNWVGLLINERGATRINVGEDSSYFRRGGLFFEWHSAGESGGDDSR